MKRVNEGKQFHLRCQKQNDQIYLKHNSEKEKAKK